MRTLSAPEALRRRLLRQNATCEKPMTFIRQSRTPPSVAIGNEKPLAKHGSDADIVSTVFHCTRVKHVRCKLRPCIKGEGCHGWCHTASSFVVSHNLIGHGQGRASNGPGRLTGARRDVFAGRGGPPPLRISTTGLPDSPSGGGAMCAFLPLDTLWPPGRCVHYWPTLKAGTHGCPPVPVGQGYFKRKGPKG